MEKKKITIVIPVYNAEKTLNKCIDSLLNQSYKNTEIIAINDGSTDDSLKILKQYESKIVLVNQNNMGPAVARNNGILKTTGDFIVFVDSDDYVKCDYIEKLEEGIKDNDVAITGYLRSVDDKVIYTKKPKNVPWSAFKYTSTWGKIYQSKFIKDNNIKFLDEVRIGEDLYFNILVLSKTNKVSFIDYAGYYYYDNSESLTNNINSNLETKIEKMYKFLSELDLLYDNKNDNSFLDVDKFFFFYLKTVVYYLLTFRGLFDNNHYYEVYKKAFLFLEKFEKRNNIKEKIIYMPGEELKVNVVCNLFIIFRKIKMDKMLLNLINNLKIGRIQ